MAKRKMIKYTEDEIQGFLKELGEDAAIKVKLDGFDAVLFSYEIKKLFYKKYDRKDHRDVYTRHLRGFLFMTPLERVPLFINDYKIFASWRLRIGK